MAPIASIALCLVAAAPMLHAQPRVDTNAGIDDLRRNGAVSRHLWAPEIATARIAGLQVSAGVALGLRDSVRSNLGGSAAPALTLHLRDGASVSLLSGSNGGAMLVLQTR